MWFGLDPYLHDSVGDWAVADKGVACFSRQYDRDTVAVALFRAGKEHRVICAGLETALSLPVCFCDS